jgi:hypothetical protein
LLEVKAKLYGGRHDIELVSVDENWNSATSAPTSVTIATYSVNSAFTTGYSVATLTPSTTNQVIDNDEHVKFVWRPYDEYYGTSYKLYGIRCKWQITTP